MRHTVDLSFGHLDPQDGELGLKHDNPFSSTTSVHGLDMQPGRLLIHRVICISMTGLQLPSDAQYDLCSTGMGRLHNPFMLFATPTQLIMQTLHHTCVLAFVMMC